MRVWQEFGHGLPGVHLDPHHRRRYPVPNRLLWSVEAQLEVQVLCVAQMGCLAKGFQWEMWIGFEEPANCRFESSSSCRCSQICTEIVDLRSERTPIAAI